MTRQTAARTKTMSQIRPWQAALFVVAILVLGVSLWWSVMGGERVRETDRVYVVDLASGDRYTVNVSGHAAAMYPEKNPETGEYSLWPIYKDDSGTWKLEPRAMADLQGIDTDKSALVNPATGEVKVSDRSPRRIQPGSS